MMGVKSYFDDGVRMGIREKGQYKKTVEPEHGGAAIREYYITEDTGWFSEKKKWKGLKSFGMVHKTLKKTDGSCMEEDRYYICSIEGDIEEFERAARGHWGVENCLHWHLDFTFRDDKNTGMAKTGAKNLQIMKKTALSILRLVKESYKMSMKRIRYDLSLDKAKAVVKRTYDSAVALFAMLCEKYGLDLLVDGVIISHKEGCMRGMASAHGDPEHLWGQLQTGYTMDGFRNDVAEKMERNLTSGCELDKSYHVTQGCYLRTSPGTGNNKAAYMALSHTLKGKCRAKAGQAVFRKGERFRLTKTKCVGADAWGRMKSGYWVPLVYNWKVRVE